MSALCLFTTVLAGQALVDAWRNGAIFAGQRAAVEARGGWVAELAGCPFCLLYWAPLALLALAWAPGQILLALLPESPPHRVVAVVEILRLPIYALAATRLAVMLDRIAPASLKHGRPAGK